MRKAAPKSRKLSTQEKSLWKNVTKDVIKNRIDVRKVELSLQIELAINITKPNILVVKKQSSTALDSQYLIKLMKKFDNNTHPAHVAGQGRIAAKTPTRNHSYLPEPNSPQNVPLERNIRQKLQRGRAEIDAKLDLHGYNRMNAQHKLLNFLQSAWQQGYKTVIIVTGKGDGPVSRHSLHSADFFQMPEQTSVLRSLIGEWLNSAEASKYVVGWQPAHPKHGGGGAVYVRLRNKNKYR
ncbi:MAG: Smr/MutS family protein [Rhizobiales bacterium]|nr:Smr/MutS family protein [Hyphomicrobiales bacterium]